jgi:hypothetical protein
MRGWVMCLVVSAAACAEKEATPAAGSGSASASAPAPVAPPDAAAPPDAGAARAADDGADAVAQLVVDSVASIALGKQTIEKPCVSVSILPAGDWTVAAARLKDCGDKTARSILWLFKRAGNGRWSEDYAGKPPKCWQGAPPDIAEAVAKVTRIPNC